MEASLASFLRLCTDELSAPPSEPLLACAAGVQQPYVFLRDVLCQDQLDAAVFPVRPTVQPTVNVGFDFRGPALMHYLRTRKVMKKLSQKYDGGVQSMGEDRNSTVQWLISLPLPCQGRLASLGPGEVERVRYWPLIISSPLLIGSS
jgi:hypothetical protein